MSMTYVIELTLTPLRNPGHAVHRLLFEALQDLKSP